MFSFAGRFNCQLICRKQLIKWSFLGLKIRGTWTAVNHYTQHIVLTLTLENDEK